MKMQENTHLSENPQGIVRRRMSAERNERSDISPAFRTTYIRRAPDIK